ncbi:MAG: Nif3-like dinuclear metal center hexameric protein [Actinobacteria bacterium]|nr:Nif3-like dinuclear metal center hexameric protein [Actinomycetota bacterium]
MTPSLARRVRGVATVEDVVHWIESSFPPELAESWDAVGLVCGRAQAAVRSIRVVVDVTEEVVANAIADEVDFVLAHHPLLLSGVSSVAPSDHKGRIIHDLIEHRIALYVAHTSADSARPGVSDALGNLLGVTDLRPLEPVATQPLDKVTVYVPTAAVQPLLNALSQAGAGEIGNYERCAYVVAGRGTFVPKVGADPYVGRVGVAEEVEEQRVEMVLPRARRSDVVAALHEAHPYEEPAFDITELAASDSHFPASAAVGVGIGRVGQLGEQQSLRDFAEVVAATLPQTHHGVRVAGDLDSPVRTVALCGGSGDSLLDTATASGADVYVTSDLKHHRVSEHLADGGCAIIDVAHFASEYPWCDQTAAALSMWLAESDATVSVTVSSLVTDPWTAHLV